MCTNKFTEGLRDRKQLREIPNQPTFAALRPVVGIPSWAIAAFHGSHRVHAFAFAVAAAIVLQAFVHV